LFAAAFQQQKLNVSLSYSLLGRIKRQRGAGQEIITLKKDKLDDG